MTARSLTRRSVLAGAGASSSASRSRAPSPSRARCRRRADRAGAEAARQPRRSADARCLDPHRCRRARSPSSPARPSSARASRRRLLQIAAEELEVEPGRHHAGHRRHGQTPNEGYTAGSQSMQNSGTAIRHAAAQVREILIAEAARRLGVPRRWAQRRRWRRAGGGRTRVALRRAGRRRHLCMSRRRPQSRLKDSRRLPTYGPVDAAGRYPGQGHGRRRLCAGPAPARHACMPASCGRRATAARLTERGHRRRRGDAGRRSRSCATAASSPSSPSANGRPSRRCARWRRRALGGDAEPAAPGRALRRRCRSMRVAKTASSSRKARRQPAGACSRRPTRAPIRCTARSARPARWRSHDGDALTVWTHTQGVFPDRERDRGNAEACRASASAASTWRAPAATAITAPTMPPPTRR